MDERSRRIARARLLRRDGKTYDEIRAVIGSVDDSTLRTWLRGIPRPPGTFRVHAKDALRRRCRELRRLGYTYSEIAELTGASAGSISPWVRDVEPISRDRAERRRLAGLRRSARVRGELADRRRRFETDLAAARIGPLDDQSLFLVGVALCWAEGSKSKSYDIREDVRFVNSDPSIISVFMAWLRLVGVSLEHCGFRVAIHETADVAAAEHYWAQLVGVDHCRLFPTTIKRHRPTTNRLNTGEGYRGCLVVSVRRSAQLYRAIEGWWRGIDGQVTRNVRRSADWGDLPPWGNWQSRRPLEP